MFIGRFIKAAVFAVGATMVAAPFAGATGVDRIIVEPSYFHTPSNKISAVCHEKDLESVTLISKAFVAPAKLSRAGTGEPLFSGTFGVVPKIAVGVYPVSFTCSGKKITNTIEIRDSGDQFIDVKPSTAKPGQRVTVAILCGGQKVNPRNLTAPVLDVTSLREIQGHVFEVAGTVVGNAKPGTHNITYKCGESVLKGTIRVIAANTRGQVIVKPRGAAETGAGSMAVTF